MCNCEFTLSAAVFDLWVMMVLWIYAAKLVHWCWAFGFGLQGCCGCVGLRWHIYAGLEDCKHGDAVIVRDIVGALSSCLRLEL